MIPTDGRSVMETMPRTVAPEVRRDAIVDVAERLIRTKGYARMSVQDVQDELGVSRGAIYHYFPSKAAMLDAVLARAGDAVIAAMAPIADDAALPALAKLQGVFDAGGRWKAERRDLTIGLLRAWYSDDNTVVREQLRRILMIRVTPLLAGIVSQGRREGIFTPSSPDHAAAILVALLEGSGDTISALVLAHLDEAVPLDEAERLVAAYDEAIERILGLAPGSFHLVDPVSLRAWFP
jgi:AcrR family transcriptional regulator